MGLEGGYALSLWSYFCIVASKILLLPLPFWEWYVSNNVLSPRPQENPHFYLQENKHVLAPKYKPEWSSTFPPGKFFCLASVGFFFFSGANKCIFNNPTGVI